MRRVSTETGLLAGWALLAALVVSLPIPVLLRHSILVDDTFYALAAARHLAAGDGSTVDGIHPTNGYQPLWVWILAALTAGLKLGPDGTVRAALLLCAMATGATGVLAARLVRDRGGSGTAARWAAALWLFNPYLLKRQFNGLESALAALLLLAVLKGACAAPSVAWRGEPGLGIRAGLAALARIDLLALAPFLAIRRRWLAASAALGIAFPWLLWSKVRFGSWVPLSGEASRVWAAVLEGAEPGAGFHWNPDHAGLALAWLFGLGWPAQALVRLGAPASWIWLVVPATLGILLCAAAPGAGLGARLRAWWLAAGPLRFWSLTLTLAYWAAYALAYPAPWHLNRYFLPVHALVCVWAGLFYGRVIGPGSWPDSAAAPPAGEAAVPAGTGAGRRVRVWRLLWGAAFAAGLVPLLLDTTHGHHPGAQLEVARWIRERVPAELKVGLLQSGVAGYYAQRPIVNLDGKVNPEAMRALRDGAVWDYLRRERIDLFGDYNDLAELLFERSGSDAMRSATRRLPAAQGPAGPFTFYRVTPPPPPAAARAPTDPRAW